MNPEQHEFQELRRLLVLKRYEQPPPGYFDDFSRQVIAGIRCNAPMNDFSWREVLSWEAPWLQRILGLFEARPVLAGGFGVAVCGLLVSGMLLSEARENSYSSNNAIPTATPPQTEFEQTAGASPFSAAVVPVSASATPAALAPANDSLFRQLKDTRNPQVLLINAAGTH